MVNIIIVDDDVTMRQYLKAVINWENEGFRIVGEADNGKTALSLIKELSPDIAVVDMDMPIMNGVDLIKEVYDGKLKTMVLVLSCYDDFEYVKQAMKYGAVDYLLKHKIEPEELLEILVSIRDTKLQSTVGKGFEGKFSDEYENQGNKTIHNINITKKKIVYHLINNLSYFRDEEVIKDLNGIGLSLDSKNIVVIKGQIDYYNRYIFQCCEESRELLNFTVLNIIESLVSETEKGIVVPAEEGKFIIIISLAGEKSRFNIEKRVYEFLSKIQAYIKKYTQKTTTFGVSEISNSIISLGVFYSQANKALQYKIYKGLNRIINFREVSYNDEIEDIFNSARIIGERTEKSKDAVNEINKVFEEIKLKKPSSDKFDILIFRLQSMLANIAFEKGVVYEEIVTDKAQLYNAFYQLEVVDDFNMFFIDMCNKIIGALKRNVTGFRQEIIKAMEFINDNIDKNISLQEIADHINLSRTYFSQLFKQNTGENIVDYISKVRVEKAKKLLLDPNAKVYEIAMNIGFESQYYFNKLFKNLVGMTPTEYRHVKLYKS